MSYPYKKVPNFYDNTRAQYDEKVAAGTIDEKALYFVLEPNGTRTLYKGSQIVGAKLDDLDEALNKLNTILQNAPEEFDTFLEIATTLSELETKVNAGINWWDLLSEPNLKRYEKYVDNPMTQEEIKARGMLNNLTYNGILPSWDWGTFFRLKHGFWFFESDMLQAANDMRPPLEIGTGALLVMHGGDGEAFIAFDNWFNEIFVGTISEGGWSGWKKILKEGDTFKFRGEYDHTKAYNKGDIVKYSSTLYECSKDGTVGKYPSGGMNQYWSYFVNYTLFAEHVPVNINAGDGEYYILIQESGWLRPINSRTDLKVVNGELHDKRGKTATENHEHNKLSIDNAYEISLHIVDGNIGYMLKEKV